jgi:hypothetical protein
VAARRRVPAPAADGVPLDQAGSEDRRGARLRCSASPVEGPEPDWPYAADPDGKPATPIPLTLIPYSAWANRGPSSMRVWLPEQP